jgi:hypothetical protein
MTLNARLRGSHVKKGLWTKLWLTLLMFQPMLTEKVKPMQISTHHGACQ